MYITDAHCVNLFANIKKINRYNKCNGNIFIPLTLNNSATFLMYLYISQKYLITLDF